METKQIKVLNIDHKGAARCSDYDDDCAEVTNHFKCWVGDEVLPPSDGYCPYVSGMKQN
ncbi:hypothetical protein [Pseudoalteromonas peptidolytica]|uniref:Uncharacterized protein n=1 Tax=Pseudoalteromonas peptidolytica F12-50-A1 TaxID=1315280 RepID=A0A8I0MZM5_9GAMM|nr:hypothetical protein [Pseudoalteromonas peptidolytica]MBE0348238.1 hypothetical protein [Pseudoalteromonas peptidolytica F12-50-A1]